MKWNNELAYALTEQRMPMARTATTNATRCRSGWKLVLQIQEQLELSLFLISYLSLNRLLLVHPGQTAWHQYRVSVLIIHHPVGGAVYAVELSAHGFLSQANNINIQVIHSKGSFCARKPGV